MYLCQGVELCGSEHSLSAPDNSGSEEGALVGRGLAEARVGFGRLEIGQSGLLYRTFYCGRRHRQVGKR